MNYKLPSIIHPSLKQLLLSRLQTVLGLYVTNRVLMHQHRRHLSLQLVKYDRQVLYVSPIALELSSALKAPAIEIATAIAQLLSNLAGSSLIASHEPNITVRVIPSGWIHFLIHPPLIAACLQRLVTDGASPAPKEEAASPASNLFPVQYAHARCCSLVQMGYREGLIKLSSSQKTNSIFCLSDPKPIPWLDSYQELCLVHPAERYLIAQLLKLLDDFPEVRQNNINQQQGVSDERYACGRAIDWEKTALSLSQAFQSFYSSIRIWGETKIRNPSLAQARLGLVLATQSILYLLLKELFGIYAPLEL